MNDKLLEIITDALETEKKEHGRRFSTHHEGQAYLRESYETATTTLTTVGDGLSFLWVKLKDGVVDKEYTDVLEEMERRALAVVLEIVNIDVLIRKLEGGVVHEGKQ